MSGALKVVVVVAGFVALLVVELIAAMLAYIYLAIYNIELFGYLVRHARVVLDIFSTQFEALFPQTANAAYATLLGELGPKSILLLLLGLVVGAFIRLVLWGVRQAVRSYAG